MGYSRRSGTFGLVGVVVTAVAVAIVALEFGQGQANPKGALAAIFAIIAAYVSLLFLFQTLDLNRAERASARSGRAHAGDLANPAVLDEPSLWAAMAVHRIDADAIEARRAMWGVARESLSTGKLITLLIFLTVPPIYLLDTFLPLVIGGPVIAGIALWKSFGLLGGSVLEEAYDKTDRAMRPLGLRVSEHPHVTIEVKGVTPYRLGPAVQGALVLEGERDGRPVAVRMPSGGERSKCEVVLGVATPEFEFRARDGRLRAEPGAPLVAGDLLQSVPNSPRWNGVRGSGGPRGLSVTRRSGANGDWLLDLWLAERLAEALDRVPA